MLLHFFTNSLEPGWLSRYSNYGMECQRIVFRFLLGVGFFFPKVQNSSEAQVKNEWNCTSPPLCAYIERNFTVHIALVLHLFNLTSLANLHNLIICALSFSV